MENGHHSISSTSVSRIVSVNMTERSGFVKACIIILMQPGLAVRYIVMI